MARVQSLLSAFTFATKSVMVLLFLTICAFAASARTITAIPGTVTLKGDFGAIGDGVSDDSDAFDAFLAACSQSECHAERGRYRITRRPRIISDAILLRGDGIDTTEFIRDYDEEFGRGFLHFEGLKSGRGVSLSDFSIHSAAGRHGGHAIAAISLPGKVCCNMSVSHVKLSTLGTDSWDNTVLLDGMQNTVGAIGIREVMFSNCLIFGAAGYSLSLKGVVGFSFIGGGTYPAGGVHPLSGGILITGSPAVRSSGITIIGDHFGYLNLSHTVGAKITAASGITSANLNGIQTALNADDTVELVQILAELFGKVSVEWKRSSIIRPDGTISNR